MRNVLADLQLELEGSVAMTMRMGEALDRCQADAGNEHEALLLRLGLPVGKYWICKRTPNHAYEAMECLGGNGVTEDFILARLYRDAPINAIWEGSGNIQALDMLRAVSKSPEVLDAWFDELASTRSTSPVLDRAVTSIKDMLSDADSAEYRARRLVEGLALTMQASLLLRADCPAVAEAFIASRLDHTADRNYGTLPVGCDLDTILERADPLRG